MQEADEAKPIATRSRDEEPFTGMRHAIFQIATAACQACLQKGDNCFVCSLCLYWVCNNVRLVIILKL